MKKNMKKLHKKCKINEKQVSDFDHFLSFQNTITSPNQLKVCCVWLSTLP